MRESFERYSGVELEMDLLGEGVKPAARYDGNYKGFRESVDLVRANQPEGWNPEDPPAEPTSLPNDLHFAVLEALQKELEHESHEMPGFAAALLHYAKEGKLRLWNASGSYLDKLHGVDAFFTFSPYDDRRPGAQEVVYTIDVTKNTGKTDHKADQIILLNPEAVDYAHLPSREKERLMHEYGKQIASGIVSKVERLLRSGRTAA